MKKKFASQSAPPRRGLGEGGFFNARLMIGYFVAITGAPLALAGLDVLSAPAASLTHSGYRAPVANGVPRPDHVVMVIEENHSYSEIIGSSPAPYINSLAAQGALSPTPTRQAPQPAQLPRPLLRKQSGSHE